METESQHITQSRPYVALSIAALVMTVIAGGIAVLGWLPSFASGETIQNPEAPTSFTAEINGVTYQLVESAYTNGGYEAWVEAINHRGDTSVCLRFSTHLFDSEGQQHQVTERVFNNRLQHDCVNVSLPHGLPVKFGLRFRNVASSVTEIPRLDVVLRHPGFGAGGDVLTYEGIPVPYTAN